MFSFFLFILLFYVRKPIKKTDFRQKSIFFVYVMTKITEK